MIHYKANWKYMLEREESHDFLEPPKNRFTVTFSPCTTPHPPFCGRKGPCYSPSDRLFSVNGKGVTAAPECAWDGPSGPTVDTENSMRASLVHDVLYQAMREGGLPQEARAWADREFRRILKADSMWWPRQWCWWLGVGAGGAGNAKPKRRETVEEGP